MRCGPPGHSFSARPFDLVIIIWVAMLVMFFRFGDSVRAVPGGPHVHPSGRPNQVNSSSGSRCCRLAGSRSARRASFGRKTARRCGRPVRSSACMLKWGACLCMLFGRPRGIFPSSSSSVFHRRRREAPSPAPSSLRVSPVVLRSRVRAALS